MKRLFCYLVALPFLQMLFISQESAKAIATRQWASRTTVLTQDVTPVINPPNPQTNIVISLADYLTGNVTVYDAMNQALIACQQQHVAKLIIPTGTYRFDDPKVLQNGYHIGLGNQSDLVIDGQGSEFIFHYPRNGILINNSQRIVFRNLTVDTDLQLASLGVVQKVGGSTNIRILDSYPVNASTPVLGVAPYDIQNLKWKAIPGQLFNPRNVSMVGAQTFTSPDFNSLTDGEEVIVRHYFNEGSAFNIPNFPVSDVSFENITIYGAPGMGFYIAGQRGFRLSNCKIMQKPGAQRPISTATDGAHFTNTSGDILVEDCDFSGQGDDSLNITSLWVTVTEKVNSRIVILTRQYNEWTLQQGSELKFVKSSNLAEYARLKATQVSYDQSTGRFTVTVDQDLPSTLAAGDLAINLTQNNSKFLVRRNYFHDHNGRGMLIQSPNGVVENNRVENPTWQCADLFTDGRFFLEGPGVESLIVRNNTFEGCSYGNYGTLGETMAAVNVTAEVPPGISDYPVNKNLLIEGNTISDTPGLAMFISSASGITVSNNVIIKSNTLGAFPSWYGSSIGVTPHGSIMVTRASDVTVTGNRQIISPGMVEKGIYVDPQTTSNIVVRDNTEERGKPNIEAVEFDGKKKLTVKGNNFDSASRVLINENDRTSFLSNVSATEINLKGKAKKLKLKSGDNTIRVIDSSGGASNLFLLRL